MIHSCDSPWNRFFNSCVTEVVQFRLTLYKLICSKIFHERKFTRRSCLTLIGRTWTLQFPVAPTWKSYPAPSCAFYVSFTCLWITRLVCNKNLREPIKLDTARVDSKKLTIIAAIARRRGQRHRLALYYTSTSLSSITSFDFIDRL